MRLKLIIFTLVSGAVFNSFSQEDTSKVYADSVDQIMISLSADDLESDVQNQDVSSLLQSSRDVFSSIAGYNFSNARYRMRGLRSQYYTVMMNGVPMNTPEQGYAIWAYWGGLNDVMRYPEVGNNLTDCDYNFGSIGGYSNVNLRASRFRKGSRISFAKSNRTYRNRLMATHSTGMQKNGWAYTFSLSGRWADEGYIEGTYYSGASYFFSIERKLNEDHSVSLAGFGAPTVQARSGLAVQEAYNLTGSNYYNPYWGYQTDGDSGNQVKRNARVRNNHRPSVFLTHDWEIDKFKSLSTSVYTTFGRTGSTNLNWFDAQDPRPDYYRYLPSYYALDDPTRANQLKLAWMNDPSTSQINWDALYNANYKNLYTLEDANGIEGNDVTFVRSKYIVEDYRQDPFQVGINSIYNSKFDKMDLAAGLNIDRYVSHNFKVVEDLLGGEYWVDINQFAEQDYAEPLADQNNVEEPNRLVGVGDKFGYNYDIHVNTEKLFGQLSGRSSRIDWYGGLTVSHTQFYRNGIWKNGQFPDNSQGKSEVKNFINYGVKGGADFKITGRHFVTANLMYETKAPYSSNAFISPRTRNTIVANLTNTEIIAGDLSYQVRYPNLRARASVYYTEVNDQVWSRSFYHDVFRNFVNYTMTNLDHLYSGFEAGLEKKFIDTWILSAAFATGQFLYNSKPEATVTVDNSDELLDEERTVYFEGYRIGGMPQTAASLGLKYNSPKYWYIGASFNYFTNIYLDPSPDRRTAEAVENYVVTDPQWDLILDQEVIHDLDNNPFFDNNYTIDFYAGASFKLKDKQYLRVNINLNNVADNRNFLTGGYEQLRFDSSNIGKFPPKYGYMYGTTIFAMVSYLF